MQRKYELFKKRVVGACEAVSIAGHDHPPLVEVYMVSKLSRIPTYPT